MGRAPCCEKVGLKRGRWTAEEDEKLTNYIQTHGEGSWRSLPKNAGLLRCGKSCRLRWINYLRSDLKRGNISIKEEELIIKLHASLGNKWSLIAGHLPGRTDNEIKNYWNSHLSRKIQNLEGTTNEILPPNDKNNNLNKRRGGRTSRFAMKRNKTYLATLEHKKKLKQPQNDIVSAHSEKLVARSHKEEAMGDTTRIDQRPTTPIWCPTEDWLDEKMWCLNDIITAEDGHELSTNNGSLFNLGEDGYDWYPSGYSSTNSLIEDYGNWNLDGATDNTNGENNNDSNNNNNNNSSNEGGDTLLSWLWDTNAELEESDSEKHNAMVEWLFS